MKINDLSQTNSQLFVRAMTGQKAGKEKHGDLMESLDPVLLRFPGTQNITWSTGQSGGLQGEEPVTH